MILLLYQMILLLMIRRRKGRAAVAVGALRQQWLRSRSSPCRTTPAAAWAIPTRARGLGAFGRPQRIGVVPRNASRQHPLQQPRCIGDPIAINWHSTQTMTPSCKMLCAVNNYFLAQSRRDRRRAAILARRCSIVGRATAGRTVKASGVCSSARRQPMTAASR